MSSRKLLLRLLLAAALLLMGFASAPRAALAAADAPAGGRLVVLVVVDQLRYADLLLLEPELGARGFAGSGPSLAMRYETVGPETAADHATLSTGAYAADHGIVGNTLWDGSKEVPLVADASCPVWGKPAEGRGPGALRVPTIGDTLKLASRGRSRVVSVAGKDRSAVFLAGASADLALWWDAETGRFTSSSCYAPVPPAWLDEVRASHPASEWRGWVWKPSRPESVLSKYGAAETAGTTPRHGMGARFSHTVGRGDVSPRLHAAILASPAGTTVTLRMAGAAAERMHLGEGETTDLLLVGLSTVDKVGHAFGTSSWERVDALLRMHDELGRFFRDLRERLGAHRLAVMVTSDHGLTAIPEQAARWRLPSGRIDLGAVSRRVSDVLDRAYPSKRGPRSWIAHASPPALHLARVAGVEPADAARIAAAVIRAEPGIWRVLTADDVEREPAESPFRHAFFAGRSGDLLVVARPGWVLTAEGDDATQHRSHWNDDALVPLLFSAPGFELRPALLGATATATQVAPSLAVLLGVPPPSGAMADPVLMRRTAGPR